MIQFEAVKLEEISIIKELAHQIWPTAFQSILSKDQIAFMLNWMYSISKLEEQFESGHEFYVAKKEGKSLGFIGIEHNFPTKNSLRIHKFYLLPEAQGIGIGKQFLSFAEQIAKHNHLNVLHLNVNRFNQAVEFYKHIGFKIIGSEDNEIGNGYLMEDYVMTKQLDQL